MSTKAMKEHQAKYPWEGSEADKTAWARRVAAATTTGHTPASKKAIDDCLNLLVRKQAYAVTRETNFRGQHEGDPS